MNKKSLRCSAVLTLALAASACSTPRADLPTGPEAYSIIPPTSGKMMLREYKIAPGDTVAVTVYREPDLSLPSVQVDTAGKIAIPLIGTVVAAGHTAEELSTVIRDRLNTNYLRNPEVAVNVTTAASQRIVVEGSVNSPGVFDVRGDTTLLGAMAMAKGPSQIAALEEIAVFRRIDGKLYAAKFDLRDIRLGKAPDPAIRADDTIVVGFSGLKSAYRDLLQALPTAALFRPLYD